MLWRIFAFFSFASLFASSSVASDNSNSLNSSASSNTVMLFLYFFIDRRMIPYSTRESATCGSSSPSVSFLILTASSIASLASSRSPERKFATATLWRADPTRRCSSPYLSKSSDKILSKIFIALAYLPTVIFLQALRCFALNPLSNIANAVLLVSSEISSLSSERPVASVNIVWESALPSKSLPYSSPLASVSMVPVLNKRSKNPSGSSSHDTIDSSSALFNLTASLSFFAMVQCILKSL
mmetsp:Transcript_26880/g.63148  ORF Transcript_26880/g.63148 Transcript_26880/m.63148 type:complete len:241 (-) Transcript_26880:311-1033(-)